MFWGAQGQMVHMILIMQRIIDKSRLGHFLGNPPKIICSKNHGLKTSWGPTIFFFRKNLVFLMICYLILCSGKLHIGTEQRTCLHAAGPGMSNVISYFSFSF